jgi:hypothetical protein
MATYATMLMAGVDTSPLQFDPAITNQQQFGRDIGPAIPIAGIAGSLRSIGTKALVKRGSDITQEVIQTALRNDTVMASQRAVDLSLVQKYFDQLLVSPAPNIKMVGNVVTDGHHRYIAGKIFGQMPGVDPGVLTNASKANVVPFYLMKIY